MYGKGAYSLAKDIGVSVKEADAFLKNYLAAFPKVSGYMDKTIADAKAVGYVSTLFGPAVLCRSWQAATSMCVPAANAWPATPPFRALRPT